MSDEAFDVLCRCARLNAAVARARRALVSARAGVSLAKRDLREKRTTPAKLAEEAIREAAAEDALRDAVAAWARDGHRLRDELREARRGRMRVTIGDNFDAAVAALTARFGEPDPESRTRTKHGRAPLAVFGLRAAAPRAAPPRRRGRGAHARGTAARG